LNDTTKNFEVINHIQVTTQKNQTHWIALSYLNEIEMINGWIFSNVWHNKNIYIINPYNGKVYGIIQCQHVFPTTIKKIANSTQ